ncbi:hypothetical protein D3C84_907040 [compost metagenome]
MRQRSIGQSRHRCRNTPPKAQDRSLRGTCGLLDHLDNTQYRRLHPTGGKHHPKGVENTFLRGFACRLRQVFITQPGRQPRKVMDDVGVDGHVFRIEYLF